jgi:hypothetical protein
MRVVAEYGHGIYSAPLIGGIDPEPLEVVDDRAVTRLALWFRFPPASKAETALDLVTVIAAAPQKESSLRASSSVSMRWSSRWPISCITHGCPWSSPWLAA